MQIATSHLLRFNSFVRLAIDKLGCEAAVKADRSIPANIAASFQERATRHLEQQLRRAIQFCERRMP